MKRKNKQRKGAPLGNKNALDNDGGRPSKLTPTFIIAAKKILNEDMNTIIHTDEDLLFLINEELEDEERISEATFKNWKVKTPDKSDVGFEFLSLYKKALILQRKNLFKSFKKDPSWQRWAWILERKFDSWNLKRRFAGVLLEPENLSDEEKQKILNIGL